MPTPPVPEDQINHSADPLHLPLICQGCGHTWQDTFQWAAVHPKRGEDDGWDGVVLSHVVTCSGCGAVDDYHLEELARVGLLVRVMAEGAGGGRVFLGEMRMWDGTLTRRPSQGIAHLRGLIERDPGSAEARRRLGNTLERFGRLDEAIEAWEQACELDDTEFEAAYSIALALLLDSADDQLPAAFAWLRRAFRTFPPANRQEPANARFAPQLVHLLRHVLACTDEPFALSAAWQAGEARGQPVVSISSVDVCDIEDFDRLAAFIASPDLLSLDFTAEMPQERPTQLEVRLNPGIPAALRRGPGRLERPESRVLRARGRGSRNPGNRPCPCGSGKKVKRCCGRRSSKR